MIQLGVVAARLALNQKAGVRILELEHKGWVLGTGESPKLALLGSTPSHPAIPLWSSG